jgi:hypothetical protein
MRAVQGTLILSDPPITTTLRSSAGELAATSEPVRKRLEARQPAKAAAPAAGRMPRASIVGGAVVAIAALSVVAVLFLRGGHRPAAGDTPAVSAAATPATPPVAEPAPAAKVAAQPAPAYARIEPTLPREPKHAPADEPARAPAARKPRAATAADGPAPVGDSPTGIGKAAPAPKKPAVRTGPLNGDL